MRAWLAVWLVILLPAGSAPPPAGAGPGEDLDASFARILELEDTRSSGDGALGRFLEPSQPIAVRIRAALAAGRIGRPAAAASLLIQALGDASAELRRMAAFALGEMDDPDAVPPLTAALGDRDMQARALAAEALGKLRDASCVAPVSALLDDPQTEVAGMALLALWKLESGPSLPSLVLRAAGIYQRASGDLRARAVYFLMRAQMGRPGETSIEAHLLLASRDPEPLIRSYAARGLGALRSAASTEALLRLASDEDWRVRVNAFNGLKARPVEPAPDSPSTWKIYASAIEGTDRGVALAALSALESLASERAGRALTQALGHPHPRFREVALAALAARDKAAALPALAPAASDPVWSVRARAAEALGALDLKEAPPALARLCADPDPRVRAAGVSAAGGSRQLEGRDALLAAALADPDPFVRASALEALVPVGAPAPAGVVARLAEGYARAAADPHNDARLAALGSMARAGGEEARAGIQKGLSDPDYVVRRRAAELLREHFKVEAGAGLRGPAPSRRPEEYLEAVRRARRRVTATLQTDAGEIIVELFAADAPLTVDNFLRLARSGSLDGLAVHRVVPNFVIQDGDPRGDGNGGPPWQIRCEINRRRYGTGAMGMALSGKDTGGSQWFITHSPQPHLDGGYTVFGQVISGQEAVDRIMQGDRVRRVTIQEAPDPIPPAS